MSLTADKAFKSKGKRSLVDYPFGHTLRPCKKKHANCEFKETKVWVILYQRNIEQPLIHSKLKRRSPSSAGEW